MAINWEALRSWNGSVATAFEELCCQLAASESAPAGARFFRKGTPDAGIECFWKLPDGHEWGWQAKWFRSSPNATQWRQIDGSVKRGLEKHPNLTKFTVCLPINRSDARMGNQKSFLQKWDAHVTTWERLAEKKGMAVTFEYWGESEIGTRLSDDRHRGRLWFWFNRECLNNEWFRGRVDEAVANAGDRYMPSLNIDLPIRSNFDAIGRTPVFFERLAKMYSEARIKLTGLRPPHEPRSLRERCEHIRETAPEALLKLERWVARHQECVEWSVTQAIPWDDIGTQARVLADEASVCISELLDLREQRKKDEDSTLRHAADDLNSSIHTLREFQVAVSEIAHYAQNRECGLANTPAMLLVGEAGQGKTHLLCHIAKTDTAEGMPRIILHGEQFRNEEPWSQMIRLLGLNCARDEFIGALEAAAQASNSRVLLLIDALNEGEGNRLWSKYLPGILTVLAQYPWLGLCISVRDSYEELVIPDSLDDTQLTRLHHDGFAGLAYDAASKFFEHFGIEPSAPLLLPEFNNPLFLKLFCESLRNAGLSRVPDGLRGITAIFQFYVESIDRKLSRPEWLDYDVRDSVVARAVARVADEMASGKGDYLPLQETKQMVDALLPRDGHTKSLFRHLESEGVLTVVPDYWAQTDDNWTESVRFTYQRFSDHLVAEQLLARHLDKNDPKASFSKRRTLGRLFKDERECYRNRGLLEAFAVQVPELTKRELPEVAPYLAKLDSMREAFVESLVWRDAAGIGSGTDRYINEEVLRHGDTFDAFWNVMLTLATTPRHPFNADRLHAILSKASLPERDSWWSTFLHGEWGDKGAVDRLVEWAWQRNDKWGFDDEVIRLAGLTLAWFFTTANRFLRDRATQALVRLCDSRLHVLRQIIEKLRDVDDPYVTERLLAAAYGCAMRTSDTNGLVLLATDVYGWVFESGNPPPHILLRDYARGVIETAVHRCPRTTIDRSKITPPYHSEWPGIKVPDAEDLKRLGEWKADMPRDQWARVHLYASVMRDEDFSRYVIGDLDEWSSERIGDPVKPTHQQLHDQFIDSLTPRQKEAWDTYCAIRHNVDHYRDLAPERRREEFEREFNDAELDAVLDEAEHILVSRLRRNSRKYRLFKDALEAYVRKPYEFLRENSFDGELGRRWMMQRILDLGWTAERFGEFDQSIGRHGRDARKPERIGKKYQWIAYHELLARLSDNFRLREERWGGRGPIYDCPEDARARRDIDPSCLLRKTRRDESATYTNAWWFPTRFDVWDDPVHELDWLRQRDGLPDAREIICVANPENDAKWLTLDGYYHWEQPTPIGEDRHDFRRRDLWYMLKCYLVKKTEAEELLRWAEKQSWMGRWMPESHASYGIFLGEFFWSRVFRSQDCEYYRRNGWTRGDDNRIPVEVLVADEEYGRESGAGIIDCSLDDSIFISMPCRFLVEGMKLDWRGKEGEWFDVSGKLVAFDPSVKNQGPSVLLLQRDELVDFLHSQGLTLFWTLLGEKRTIGGGMEYREDYLGYLEINGAYILEGDNLNGATRAQFMERNEASRS